MRRLASLVVLAVTPCSLIGARQGVAHATTVIELTGGSTPGFSIGGAPTRIITGHDGHLYFTEHNDPGAVARVNADGSVTEFVGGSAPGFSADAGPNDIAVGPDGNIWFSEPQLGASQCAHADCGGIARLNSNGTVTEFRGGQTPGFHGGAGVGDLITAFDNHLWFAETSITNSKCKVRCGGLARLNVDGSVSEFVANTNLPGLSMDAQPTGLAVGPDGLLWFAEPGTGGIGRLDTGSLTVTELLPGVAPGLSANTNPLDVATGPDGLMWFTQQSQGVARVNADGSVTEVRISGGKPDRITLGPDHHLWYTTSGTVGSLVRINGDGSYTGFTGGETSGFSNNHGPGGITSGPDGHLWFTEPDDPGRVAYMNGPEVTWYATSTGATAMYLQGTVDPNGTPVSDCHFTYRGMGEYSLPTGSGATGIGAGPDGKLWFAEFLNGKIGRATTKGGIDEFSLPTSGAGPYDVAAGPDHNVWFTEYETNKLARVTTAARPVITEYPVPTHGSGPYGIAAGPSGNVWFTEYLTGKIGRVTTAATPTFTEFTIPTISSAPQDITQGSDGNMWFTEYAKIGRITPAGVITEFTVPTPAPAVDAITSGPDGNIWFLESNQNKVGRLTVGATPTFSEFPIPTAKSGANTITAGPDGNVWFTERSTNAIARVSPAGTITEYPVAASVSSTRPWGIATGSDGNLWFGESATSALGHVIPEQNVPCNAQPQYTYVDEQVYVDHLLPHTWYLGSLTAHNAFGTATAGASSGSLTAPLLTSIAPASGPKAGGTKITITGGGFQRGTTVTFGNVAATKVTFLSWSKIVAVAPKHLAGKVDVTVAVGAGPTNTFYGGFTYT